MPSSPKVQRRVLRSAGSAVVKRTALKPNNAQTDSKIPRPKSVRRKAVPDWGKIHEKEEQRRAARMAKTKRPSTKAEPPQFSKLSRTRSTVSPTELGAAARKQAKRDPHDTENQPTTPVAAVSSRVTRSRVFATCQQPNQSTASQPKTDDSEYRKPVCTQVTTQMAPLDDFADATALASILDNTGVQGYETKRATMAATTSTTALNTQDYLKAGRERLSMHQKQRMSMYLKNAAVKTGIAQQDTLAVAKDVLVPESAQKTGPVSDWAADARAFLARIPATTPVGNHRRATLATTALTTTVAPTPRDEFKKRAGSMYNGPLRIEPKGTRLALTTPSRATGSATKAYTVQGKGRVDISSLSHAGSHSEGRLSLSLQRHRTQANALVYSPGASPHRQRDLPNAPSPQRNPVMSLLTSFNQTEVVEPTVDLDLRTHDGDDEDDDLDTDDLTIAELARVEEELLRKLEATRKAASVAAPVIRLEGVVERADQRHGDPKPLILVEDTPSQTSAFQRVSAFEAVAEPIAPVVKSAFQPVSAFKALPKATGSAFQPMAAVQVASTACATILTDESEEVGLDLEVAALWTGQLQHVMGLRANSFAHERRAEPGDPVAKQLDNTVQEEPFCLDFTQKAVEINRTAVLLHPEGRAALRQYGHDGSIKVV